MKKIYFYEPYFFILFGLFHLHRIYGLVNRKSYADFWLKVLNEKGIFYYITMGILAFLCILGIITFFKDLHNNYWWRYIYLIGGGYVLFDLTAISLNIKFWHKLILNMYDINNPAWNLLWIIFILLGFSSFILGLILAIKVKKNIKE